jgi:hypothetical protein
MAESGAEINHTQPNRCMVKFSPLNATKALARKNTTAVSWWMDRKYISRFVVNGSLYMPRLPRRENPDFMRLEQRGPQSELNTLLFKLISDGAGVRYGSG